MTRLAPIALVLLGCASIPDGAVPMSAADYRAALAAWQEGGQPIGGCDAYAERVLVLVLDDVRAICHADAKVHGCLSSVSPGIFGSGGYYRVIVQRRDHAGDKLVGHELAHHFVKCALRRRDDGHATPGVWDSAAGPGVESGIVEAIAP